MTFPATLHTIYTLLDNTDPVLAEHPNVLSAEIRGLENKIGVTDSAEITSHDYLLTHLPIQDGNWDAGPVEIRAATLESDVVTGTAPLTIESTTVVANLNVDQVDGCDSTDFIPARSGDMLLSSNITTPSGWTDVSTTYDNKFIRIGDDTPLTTTGGSDTHNHGALTGSTTLTAAQSGLPAHTHTVSSRQVSDPGTYWAQSGADLNPQTLTTAANSSAPASSGHTHSVSSVSNVPVYIQLRMYKKT